MDSQTQRKNISQGNSRQSRQRSFNQISEGSRLERVYYSKAIRGLLSQKSPLSKLIAGKDNSTNGRKTIQVKSIRRKNSVRRKRVHGVDADGTLFKTLHPYDPNKLGAPVPGMVRRIRRWLKAGDDVIILTARMNKVVHSPGRLRKTRLMINAVCKQLFGRQFVITAEKHPAMTDFWDNNAHRIGSRGQVIKGGAFYDYENALEEDEL